MLVDAIDLNADENMAATMSRCARAGSRWEGCWLSELDLHDCRAVADVYMAIGQVCSADGGIVEAVVVSIRSALCNFHFRFGVGCQPSGWHLPLKLGIRRPT